MTSLETIEVDLLRIKLEIQRVLNQQNPAENLLIKRENGSVRGRKFHVYNTLKRFHLRNQWKADYMAEEDAKVVVYSTSCGVVPEVGERCKKATELFKILEIKSEVRDLNINTELLMELANRIGLTGEDRGAIYSSLPLIYVNGRYFGNHLTLIELNERGELMDFLAEFQGHKQCKMCGGAGYHPCSSCNGGKKSQVTFQNRNLRAFNMASSTLVLRLRDGAGEVCSLSSPVGAGESLQLSRPELSFMT
uniref:Glutaredoxin domain-containing protein n=1 Tax=Ditylenchus dipsaci TaxID=166011 RepID=A0A915D4I8_9BILA